MPHISVKIYPGRSEQQKAELAEAMAREVVENLYIMKSHRIEESALLSQMKVIEILEPAMGFEPATC